MGSAMSSCLTTAILPASGVGVQAVVAHLPVGAIASAARTTLPFTGIALGLYISVALLLITVGFLLRFVGERRTA
jgi:hypothetical protein